MNFQQFIKEVENIERRQMLRDKQKSQQQAFLDKTKQKADQHRERIAAARDERLAKQAERDAENKAEFRRRQRSFSIFRKDDDEE